MFQADNVQNVQAESNTDNNQRRSNSFFESISPRSGPLLAALTADLLADGLDANQIVSLAAFVTIIGDSLGFIAVQMGLQEDSGASDTFTR